MKDEAGCRTPPALTGRGHGRNTFDHAGYARMAKDDRYGLLGDDISDVGVMLPRMRSRLPPTSQPGGADERRPP